MKIRIKGNSIRYRLTKSEVETFCDNGHYQECTNFGTKNFTYSIRVKKDIHLLEAEFKNNTITIYVQLDEIKDWASNDNVGFKHKYLTESGTELLLSVEKDFMCMDETVEDQSDNYPNPKAYN
jgi:hypothetical protein